MSSSGSSPSSTAVALRAPPPSGRLAVLTAYAMAATAIPIPFLPDRILSRIRGAVVQDVVSRHGLSLTSDARDMLAEPESESRTKLVKAAEGVARQLLRRLRPLGVLNAASRGVEIFALGLLLDRYIVQVRATSAVRMNRDEARQLRAAIDKSVLRALSPTLRPNQTTLEAGAEDLRDEFTRWIDAFLLTSATLPSYLERRLESAFDQVVAESPEMREGSA
jgi:hypothetical protein